MKKIKLSGRELSVIRAIDFAAGTSGPELLHHTRLELEDLVDIVNSFLTIGFIETVPSREQVTQEEFPELIFQINPGYSKDLSNAIRNRW